MVTVLESDGTDAALTTEEEIRIIEATKSARKYEWDLSTGHKFYLCDEMHRTSFSKTSPGGIPGHRYFDIRDIVGGNPPGSSAELASAIAGKTWELGVEVRAGNA